MRDYLTLAEVIAMQDDQIERYGGAPGVRDLRTAGVCARPQTGYYAQ